MVRQISVNAFSMIPSYIKKPTVGKPKYFWCVVSFISVNTREFSGTVRIDTINFNNCKLLGKLYDVVQDADLLILIKCGKTNVVLCG